MLGLKLVTDPIWVHNVVAGNLEEILTDHAWCEQKAASNAISLIVRYPERTEMVQVMTALVKEEISHFEQVHQILLDRGLQLGPERKDDYVNELKKFIPKGGSREQQLTERLLFAAMIEARSCERFKVLADHIDDEELAKFYLELMASEARHYTTFLKLAKKYQSPEIVQQRWEEWLDYEASVITQYGKKERIHG